MISERPLREEELPKELRSSIFAVRIQYGSVPRAMDHIPPYFDFGIMPADYLAQRGWVWFDPGPIPLPRAFLRKARRLFPKFVETTGWTLTAHFEVGNECAIRFGRFFGFREVARTAQHIYARRF